MRNVYIEDLLSAVPQIEAMVHMVCIRKPERIKFKTMISDSEPTYNDDILIPFSGREENLLRRLFNVNVSDVLIANYSVRRQSNRSASQIFVFVGRAVYPVAVFWDRLVNLYRPATSQCFGATFWELH